MKKKKIQEEKKIAIKKITDEMANVKENLEFVNQEKKELTSKVEELELEIQKLNEELKLERENLILNSKNENIEQDKKNMSLLKTIKEKEDIITELKKENNFYIFFF